MPYQELDVLDYIKQTQEHSRVIWIGRRAELTDTHGFVLGKSSLIPLDELATIFSVNEIKARKWTIDNPEQWEAFVTNEVTDTYVLACTYGKTWKDLDGKKYRLYDWYSSVSRKDSSPFDNNIILTVYDTETDRRLIIDGVHRAAIITGEAPNTASAHFQKMEIWECYGELVNVIFPCDILQL